MTFAVRFDEAPGGFLWRTHRHQFSLVSIWTLVAVLFWAPDRRLPATNRWRRQRTYTTALGHGAGAQEHPAFSPCFESAKEGFWCAAVRSHAGSRNAGRPLPSMWAQGSDNFPSLCLRSVVCFGLLLDPVSALSTDGSTEQRFFFSRRPKKT